jgi:hypothetical protein
MRNYTHKIDSLAQLEWCQANPGEWGVVVLFREGAAGYPKTWAGQPKYAGIDLEGFTFDAIDTGFPQPLKGKLMRDLWARYEGGTA